MNRPYDIYLAGPFFTPEQVATMDAALKGLRTIGFHVFNPREHGPVIVNVPLRERTPSMLDDILGANISGLLNSWATFACIDDRDTGTAWELGFSYATGQAAYSFSGRGFGANVMIARSVLGHFPSVDKMLGYASQQFDAIKAGTKLARVTPATTEN
jgi:nucleoside 2-deoxyribosyltransferase